MYRRASNMNCRGGYHDQDHYDDTYNNKIDTKTRNGQDTRKPVFGFGIYSTTTSTREDFGNNGRETRNKSLYNQYNKNSEFVERNEWNRRDEFNRNYEWAESQESFGSNEWHEKPRNFDIYREGNRRNKQNYNGSNGLKGRNDERDNYRDRNGQGTRMAKFDNRSGFTYGSFTKSRNYGFNESNGWIESRNVDTYREENRRSELVFFFNYGDSAPFGSSTITQCQNYNGSNELNGSNGLNGRNEERDAYREGNEQDTRMAEFDNRSGFAYGSFVKSRNNGFNESNGWVESRNVEKEESWEKVDSDDLEEFEIVNKPEIADEWEIVD